MKAKKIFLIILALGVKTLYAQDPEFSQFYNNPLYTNPAFAGSAINKKDNKFATRLALNYSNQWPTSQRSYQTVNASWDKPFNKLRGGVGALLTRNIVGNGLITNSTISALYSYIIPVNKNIYVRTGLQASYVNRRLNFNNLLLLESLFEPEQGVIYFSNQPLPKQHVSFFNLGLGAVAYMKNIHLGFALHNITQPNQSFNENNEAKLHKRLTLHGGGNFQVFKQSKLKNYIQPNVLLINEYNSAVLNITTNYQLGRVLFGAGYRPIMSQFGNSDAAIGIIGYKAPRFQAIFSNDFTVSRARPSKKFSPEIALIYLISLKKNIPDLEGISPSY